MPNVDRKIYWQSVRPNRITMVLTVAVQFNIAALLAGAGALLGYA